MWLCFVIGNFEYFVVMQLFRRIKADIRDKAFLSRY